MQVRNYTNNDRPALLDFVASRNDWGPGEIELGRGAFDGNLGLPGLEPEFNCFLLEDAGALSGYSLVFPELAIGRAVIEMSCASAVSGGPGERALLARSVERAEALGAAVTHICIAEGSGLRPTLEEIGFGFRQTYFEMVWEHESLATVTTPDGFSVRPFQDGDAALLTRVQNASFDGSFGFCPNTVEQIEHRTSMANTSPHGIQFLFDRGSPAGYCWTLLTPAGGQVRGIIGMIGVVPEYRGRGVSRSILHAGMAYLKTQGVVDIGLEVDGNNTPAVGLYTSTGFEKRAERYWFELKSPGTSTPLR